MTFVHDDAESQQLVGIVAAERGLSPGLVEKDYCVTHSLWALHAADFDVWFKGATSLSKGFGLIERFSEDLDLKIKVGTVRGLPAVSNWRGDGTAATAERKACFTRLAELLPIAGATVDVDAIDTTWGGANLRATRPGRHLAPDMAEVAESSVLAVVEVATVCARPWACSMMPSTR